MSLTSETITFPNESIGVISGVPTSENLREILQRLYGNAASIKTEFNGGQVGWLGLVLSDTQYTNLTGHVFAPPLNPGIVPNYPEGATAAQVRAADTTHKRESTVYKSYVAAENALKQQLINAISEVYIKTLSTRYTGYSNVTTRQIINHLIQTYGKPTERELENNDKAFRTPYDVDQPIITLFSQLEDAVELAEAGDIPYTDEQVLHTGYSLILNTGVYNEQCREWRAKPAAEKTWANFKTHFTQAEKDYRHDQTTSRQQGYHQANAAIIEQQTAIANLATSHTNNNQLLATLTESNQQLLEQLRTRDTQITTMQQQIANLLAISQNNNNHQYQPNPRDRHNGRGRGRGRGWNHRREAQHYCWTHGGCTHTSQQCTNRREGHQENATFENRQGGNPNRIPRRYQ